METNAFAIESPEFSEVKVDRLRTLRDRFYPF
jgi:hypothetical protein